MPDPRLTETCRHCPHVHCPRQHGAITAREAAGALAAPDGMRALFRRHPALAVDDLRRAIDGFLECAAADGRYPRAA